ncbi:MAG: transposase [Thermaceae bacterium]|nr:transposase [Thermaceae bacterium]
MSYDPPQRRSVRLKGFDYASAGAFFVTVRVQKRECLWGDVRDGEVCLTDAERMVVGVWEGLRERFPFISLDAFVVIPNHVHGIIIRSDTGVGAGLVPALHALQIEGRPQGIAPTLGDVVGAFKSLTTHRYISGIKNSGWPTFDKRPWQRNYYERILRNEDELKAIREYIVHNPLGWAQDQENPNARPVVAL